MTVDKKEYAILVIEDNAGDFALVEDFLFEYIYTPKITRAVSFYTASEQLTMSKFDAVLLDLTLPDKMGHELIKQIVEKSNDAPVIVLTGYTDLAFGLSSLALGISDYMLKDDLTATSLYKSIIYCIERKKNSLQLALSEKEYSNLFNFSPLPMWVFDPESLKFLDVNNATVKHYGYSREEFKEMTLRDIRPDDEMPLLEQSIKQVKIDPASLSQNIFIHRKKNGEKITVEIKVTLVNYKGRVANFVIATDVTERSKYVKAIEQQNEKLKEISWIQSHVVRAPLARLIGLVSLLEKSVESDESEEERKMMYGYLLSSAAELDEIIGKITDTSRIEDFKL